MALKDTLTGAQSVCSYLADINLDEEIDFDDILPSEISRYCLISGLSFSCGNLVPSALKGSPNITLLGTISGNKQLSYIRNGFLYNFDQGAAPDCAINKLETYYDRTKLVDFISNLP